MKKIIALLLVAVMCFSLAACGGDNEASNNNDKEIDIKKVDVVGTWKNTSSKDHGFVMTINEDGTGTIILGEQELTITWEKTDEEIMCNTGSKELTFKIRANNGVVEMIYNDGYYVVVSEQDYNNMIEVVELTVENFNDYFDWKPYAEPRTNDFGEIEDLMMYCTVVLKDEYANKFVASIGAVEFEYSEYRCPIEYNAKTKEVTLGTPFTKEENEQLGYYVSTELMTDTTKLDNYREYGIEFCGGVGCSPDTFKVNGDIVTANAEYWNIVKFSRLQGTLYFKK